jgi:hypothetical protein
MGRARCPGMTDPRLWVGWLKFGPAWKGPHDLRFGVSAGTGTHQERHEEESGGSEAWLDGDSTFWGADVLYAYDDARPQGQGDVMVQGEYFRRRTDLDLIAYDADPQGVGRIPRGYAGRLLCAGRLWRSAPVSRGRALGADRPDQPEPPAGRDGRPRSVHPTGWA